jgi:hypothetical protein
MKQKNIITKIMEMTMENNITAVEFIEKGIKVREKHWQDQYQQGYQRALSDIMLYIEEAKQMEKEQIIENNKLKAIVEFYEQGCGKEGCKAKEPHVH